MGTVNITQEFLDRAKGLADLQGALVTFPADGLISFPNTGDVVCVVENGSAGVRTLTTKSEPDQIGRGGGGVADEVLTVQAGDIAFVPFMTPQGFNKLGQCTITVDDPTSITYALFSLRKGN